MNDLPYVEIPAFPSAVTGGALLSRLADGIGFRFRWATEGLGEGDLSFRPAADCMSLAELEQHIHGLLRWVGEAVGVDKTRPFMRRIEGPAVREGILALAQALSARLSALSDADLTAVRVTTSRGDAYPVWYLVNGPLADCLTHVGQIASWRRISGRPAPKADVFRGLPPQMAS